MNTDGHGSDSKLLHADLTEKIIGCGFDVHNELGGGFLEKVYENALAHVLRESGLRTEQQRSIAVRFRGVVVGDYVSDIIIENKVLLEIKAGSDLNPAHTAQCLNYLKATGLRVGLLINFGSSKLQFKRLVF